MKLKRTTGGILFILVIIVSFFGHRYFQNEREKSDKISKEMGQIIRKGFKSDSLLSFIDLKIHFLKNAYDTNEIIDTNILAFVIDFGMGEYGIYTIGVNKNNEMYATSPQIGKIESPQLKSDFKSISDDVFNAISSNKNLMVPFDGEYIDPQEGYYKIYAKTNKNVTYVLQFKQFDQNNFKRKIENDFLLMCSKY